MVNVIYVDMDGVLTNFNKRYFDKFGMTTEEVRSRERALRDSEEYSKNWEAFVKDREFESLEWFPGGEDLLDFLNSLAITKEILSSTGGERFHSFVEEQKNIWLDNHNIGWKRNLVPGRRYKKDFARKDALLIDDTINVVDQFSTAGGISILHRDARETINLINIYTKVML